MHLLRAQGEGLSGRLWIAAVARIHLPAEVAIVQCFLAKLKALAHADWDAEAVHLGKQAAYIWCANGILDSKVAVPLLKELAQTGTTRNWATLEKIQALMAV